MMNHITNVEAQTYEQATIEAVDELYATAPDAKQVSAGAVCAELQLRVAIHNATASRGTKWPSPIGLLPLAVARCMYRRFRIARIAGESGSSMLAMYVEDPGDPKYGTYDTSAERFRAAARQYSPGLTLAQSKEVLAMLFDWAPLVEQESNRDLIPFRNGIFDYKTKRMSPFTHERVFTAKLGIDMRDGPIAEPVIFKPDGSEWTFSSWLAEVIPDPDTRETVWDIIGAIMRPRVNWLAIVFLIGRGRNGKGTFVEVLRALVGRGNYASVSLKHFAKQTDLAPLLGVMANIVDENDETFIPSSELLKAIADHNAVTIRRLYENAVITRLHMLNVHCMNDLATLKDKSDGMTSRILAVPFEQQFLRGAGDNTAIKDDYITRQEVLEWVAYHALVERPDYYEISRSQKCIEALGAYREETDPTLQFWTEEVRGAVCGCFLPYPLLHTWYTRWLRESNPSSTPVSQRTLTRRIKDIAAGDGWVDAGDSKRDIGKWMPCYEPAPERYAKVHHSGVTVSCDGSDAMGRWYSYTDRPWRERGLVRRDVDAWCASHGTTPGDFVIPRWHGPTYRDGLVSSDAIAKFVEDVESGAIDPATASYE